MTTPPSNTYVADDANEITLSRILSALLYYGKQVLRLWWLVVLGAFFAIAFTLYRVYTTPTKYTSEVTFTINEDSGGGLLSGASALTSLLGSSSASYNVMKLIELVKTRKIVANSIFKRVEIDGESDYIANHLIRIYEYHERWGEGENEALYDFVFTRDISTTPLEDWTREEKIALKALHSKIRGSEDNPGLLTAEEGDGGILRIAVTSLHHDLSLELSEIIFEELSNFYILEATQRQRRTYMIAKAAADSLKAEIEKYERSRAAYADRTLSLQLSSAGLKGTQLAREATEASLKYAEIAKNVELSKFSLQSATPFIQVVDLPIGPLKPIRPKMTVEVLIFTIVGIFMVTVGIILFTIVRDNWPSNNDDHSVLDDESTAVA